MSQSYSASRLFGGSLLFPATLELTPSGVRFAKPALIGGREEVIQYEHIASVRLFKGLLHTRMEIETSGGSAPIVIPGLRNSDAKAIRDAIERAQATG
jgi:hypothetical protein